VLRPGEAAIIDAKSVGYPMRHIQDLPPGDYFAQALLNVYTEVHRADGYTIWVHLNDGRRESVGSASGNLYSDVQRVHIGSEGYCRIVLTHVIPLAPRPKDDQWVRHVPKQASHPVLGASDLHQHDGSTPEGLPYGDALIEEVIPDLERHFRMIPMRYARILEGASTGGWQALALQLH
jgi:hypothetical protein